VQKPSSVRVSTREYRIEIEQLVQEKDARLALDGAAARDALPLAAIRETSVVEPSGIEPLTS
jgi:hypothetical protein